MQIRTLYNLSVASRELKEMAKHGHEAKAKEAELAALRKEAGKLHK